MKYSMNEVYLNECEKPFPSRIVDFGPVGVEVPKTHVASDMLLNVMAMKKFTGCTAVKVTLRTSNEVTWTDEAKRLGTLKSPVELQSESLPVAKLIAGAKFNFRLLPAGVLRYTDLLVTPAGTVTAGKLFGALVMEQEANAY